MKTAYALIKPAISGEAPASMHFGFVEKLADSLLGWQGWTKAARTDDEIAATIEALLNPQIDVFGYRLVRAETVALKESAWTLDIEDVSIYYDGPATADEYEIRGWVERNVKDVGIKHALFDNLVEHDRDLNALGLVDAIKAQIDEAGV